MEDRSSGTKEESGVRTFRSPRERAKSTRYPGVRQLGKGRFVVRGRITDPKTGRRLELDQVIDAADVRDAALIRARLVKELHLPQRIERVMTLSDCARSWLESGKAKGEARSTLENKAQVLEGHILPYLGDLKMDRLERSDVRRWLEMVSAKKKDDGAPYSRDSVLGWWRQLSALVTWAVEELDLENDPCSRIRVAKHLNKALRIAVQSEKGTNALDEEELPRFLEVSKARFPQHYAMILVGFGTGMRWSELSALRWTDFNHEKMEIEISETQFRGTRRTRTKSGHARRVPFTKTMANAMQQHRQRLLAIQAPGLDTGLCFPSETGKPRCASVMDKPFARICKEAGIQKKLSTKVFRRTFIDLTRRAGVDEIVRRALVGHASNRMQDVYSSVGPKEASQALALVFRRLGID